MLGGGVFAVVRLRLVAVLLRAGPCALVMLLVMPFCCLGGWR
jgi:hypothetical protein